MDPVVILLIVVISIITTLLVIVGIHIIQILRELKTTLQKANSTLDHINGIAGNLHSPFGHQGGIIEGLKTGLNVAQAFAHWLTQNHLDSRQHDQ